MPRFSYLAIDRAGREKAGEVDAASQAAAHSKLSARRLLPVRVAPLAAGASAPSHAASAEQAATGKLSPRAIALFTRQFATLIDAAVPVEEALNLIAQQQDEQRVRRIVLDVHAGILEGQRLAEAMARHPRSFTPLYRSAIAGGERAGKLGFVLTRLSDYLARAEALRSKISVALIYPAALSLVASTVVACLMIFVVPSLAEQFATFDARLPLVTQILIGVSTLLSTFWPLLLLALLGGVLFLRGLLRQPAARLAFDGFALGAPLLGRWARGVNASRFARAVATLTSAGLPVVDAVRASEGAVANSAAAAAIRKIGEWIEAGEPFSHALRKSGIAPPLVSYMAASGENAGDLPGMLDKAADHLDQEFEAFTQSALSLLEPVIIVVMGGVVAAIVFAIMLPILQINQLVSG
jgi:general secretion pathway protein F